MLDSLLDLSRAYHRANDAYYDAEASYIGALESHRLGMCGFPHGAYLDVCAALESRERAWSRLRLARAAVRIPQVA